MNPFFGFANEGRWFLVGAVVLIVALDAVSWQAMTQTPTGTVGGVVIVFCRRNCKTESIEMLLLIM